jgi:hypothetical protein
MQNVIILARKGAISEACNWSVSETQGRSRRLSTFI